MYLLLFVRQVDLHRPRHFPRILVLLFLLLLMLLLRLQAEKIEDRASAPGHLALDLQDSRQIRSFPLHTD